MLQKDVLEQIILQICLFIDAYILFIDTESEEHESNSHLGRYFIHINKIYVLGYIHHNNDYLFQGLHSVSMRDTDFFTWRRNCFLRFQQMGTADEVYQELQQQTQDLEFDYYSLCVRHPVPFTRPKITVHSSYPAEWMSQYQSENYFAIDPVLKRENFIQGHLPWTDALFSEAQPLWDGARDHGIRRGITQCLMLPNHALGFLSVSRASQFGKMMDSDEIELRLQMLVQMALTSLLRFEHDMVMPPEMKFSKREKEILKWTAEGKTSAEIAIILSISENTVNFHQKNMQKKFNAPNKTQIACYAAATGFI